MITYVTNQCMSVEGTEEAKGKQKPGINEGNKGK